MRYAVEIDGRTLEVDVRDGPAGTEVAVGKGPHVPVTLRPDPAPLFVLERGDRRTTLSCEPDPLEPGQVLVTLDGRPALRARAVDARARAASKAAAGPKGPRTVKSPMPGVIVEVRVEVGVEVQKGQVLLVLEAMKMQNELRADGHGVVRAVHARVGASVAAGARLVELAASSG